MNTLIEILKSAQNLTNTENGGITHSTTNSKVLDMFGIGAAYRKRTDEDIISLFKGAFAEDKELALKCLFYIRDVRGGQGERRFFRVAFRWLCDNYSETARLNLKNVAEYGRWDDLIYSTIDTRVEKTAFLLIKKQLTLDLQSKTPSLLAKWMPSQNASSKKTKQTGYKLAKFMGLSNEEYRKCLSLLRKKINIIERLMSENRWDEIEFDKIPSRAGMIYRNAFARKDIIAEKYRRFMKNKNTKVNASTLYPHEIVSKVWNINLYRTPIYDVERQTLQKYWDNLPDYYNGRKENGIAIVDTSGSMWGTPMNAALSLGAYIADKAHGPFANHFITFSSNPHLIKFEGEDIVDKFWKAKDAEWGNNTNIKKVFDLLLSVALDQRVKKEDMPTRLYIFSDMEFDSAFSDKFINHGFFNMTFNNMLDGGPFNNFKTFNNFAFNSDIEKIKKEWANYGYELPEIVFWNLDAREKHIPAIGEGFSYVSGFSPSMIEQILGGKTGYELMIEKLINSGRYDAIVVK